MENMLGLFHKRNVFDLTHERKLSCDMGKLIPILLEEIVPGDTFKVKTDMLVRLSPLLAPVMHRMNCFIHYFFVPTRLIWSNWETFITGGVSGDDATAAPYVSLNGISAGTLADYFGLPTTNATVVASALPFRAYDLIYNEWYRDQNLQTPITINKGDGVDTTTSLDLLNRNWEKDYFTSGLPWAQRGSAVSLPLGTSAPVDVIFPENTVGVITNGQWNNLQTEGGTPGITDRLKNQETTAGLDLKVMGQHLTGTADLSNAQPITINALRQAFQVQKWMERNARAGVRYVESILSHFGVRSSDARLQRPEFLGGGKSPIVVSEVLQTSKTDNTGTPLGTMAGHGYSAQRSNQFKKSFEEHGYVIGILSILPRTAYQQGLNRSWSRYSRFDYYWPEFAHLGEQAVLNKEIYYSGIPLTDNGIFAYQGRYDEYRRRESTVHGDFRSSLNFWHMGRIFDSLPQLNSDFVKAVPTKRISAVPSEHNCWIQILNQVQAIRPIPKTGEPGLIDHN